MRKTRFLFSVMIFFAFIVKGSAQNFDYSFSYATASYSDLSSPTTILSSSDWAGFNQKVEIGFSFNFLGKSFDSVNVSSNGYLVFDNDNNYSFAAFGLPLSASNDTVASTSSIAYTIEGSSGNKILKMQYKNCSVSDLSAIGRFDFQVWIYESQNKIELKTGNITYDETTWANYSKKVGLINGNKLEDGQMALLLNGNMDSPTAATANNGDALPKITGLPSTNLTYSLTPNF